MQPDIFDDLMELFGFQWEHWSNNVRLLVKNKNFPLDDRFALFCKYPFAHDNAYMGQLDIVIEELTTKYGVENYEYSVDNEIERYASRTVNQVFDEVVEDFLNNLPFGSNKETHQATICKFEAELKELLITLGVGRYTNDW